MNITFRTATINDAEELLELATQMTKDTAFAPPVLDKIKKIILRGDWGYGQCAVLNDTKIIGFMCGYVGETFLNHQVNAYEQGLFVHPDFRGGTTVVRLIRNFEEWARKKNAANIWLGQSVNYKRESMLTFFERLGYKCQGFTTHKKL